MGRRRAAATAKAAAAAAKPLTGSSAAVYSGRLEHYHVVAVVIVAVTIARARAASSGALDSNTYCSSVSFWEEKRESLVTIRALAVLIIIV